MGYAMGHVTTVARGVSVSNAAAGANDERAGQRALHSSRLALTFERGCRAVGDDMPLITTD